VQDFLNSSGGLWSLLYQHKHVSFFHEMEQAGLVWRRTVRYMKSFLRWNFSHRPSFFDPSHIYTTASAEPQYCLYCFIAWYLWNHASPNIVARRNRKLRDIIRQREQEQDYWTNLSPYTRLIYRFRHSRLRSLHSSTNDPLATLNSVTSWSQTNLYTVCLPKLQHIRNNRPSFAQLQSRDRRC
jgi:hypothetical protein